MPTVAREGEFEFRVYTREAVYEPPHVHVTFGGAQVRINLDNGEFMEEPPPHKRRAIHEAYVCHAAEIRRKWDEIHEAKKEGKGGILA
ncbi:DUF4160 domain-containing protein [Candidatus Bipolaricaulota bacterium]|nr:DUF4160 domain-containing protein [Candidatus Bipolaricaulota bacterium]MCK4599415.1 DUF4160 domain-containing protein [Candidatus Bipolaricaulota bacterium]